MSVIYQKISNELVKIMDGVTVSDSVISTSSTEAASLKAVKMAYDLANSAKITADSGVAKGNAAQATADSSVKKAGDTMTGALKVPTVSQLTYDNTVAPTVWVKDQLRAEIEIATQGNNTVIRDKDGYPHIMVVVPRFNLQDIDSSLGTGTHPAFIVNGVTKSEIFIGKYLASKGSDNKIKTIPRQLPYVSITQEDAVTNARALGTGFGVCSNVMYAARILWLWKKFQIHDYLGNTNYGKNTVKAYQTGVLPNNTYEPGDSANTNAVTKTGSGPIEWNDDESPYGISDLVGNVWEMATGLRIKNGEFQVIENNNAMLSTSDISSSSSAWRAINTVGNLVNSGVVNTYKVDSSIASKDSTARTILGIPQLCTADIMNRGNEYEELYCQFKDFSSISGTPTGLLKVLGIYPVTNESSIQGGFSVKNNSNSELYAMRGGAFNYNVTPGPNSLWLTYPITHRSSYVGFRIGYCN